MGDSDNDGKDQDLPERLFATDRYPLSRLNVYSNTKYLCSIRKSLKNSKVWKQLVNSSFGGLFRIPVNQYAVSGKLIHALVCRQVLTRKRYEMWIVFGGQPLRFSLKEFAAVTGLPCHDFPQYYDPDIETELEAGDGEYWKTLFGDERETTLEDVEKQMRETKDKEIKLRLALLLIVDGILIATHQKQRPTPKYVEMLADIKSFLAFPWGRESFLKTINGFTPRKISGRKHVDPKTAFIKQLQQHTIRFVGFPIALQLLAYQNIPNLIDELVDTSDTRSLSEFKILRIPKQSTAIDAVHEVELRDNLAVIPMIDARVVDDGKDWEDERNDFKIDYLIEKISNGHKFIKSEWPGGYEGCRKISAPKKKKRIQADNDVELVKCKSTSRSTLAPRRSLKKRKRSKVGETIHSDRTFLPTDVEDRLASLEKEVAEVKTLAEKMQIQVKEMTFPRKKQCIIRKSLGGNSKKPRVVKRAKVVDNKSRNQFDYGGKPQTHKAGSEQSETEDDVITKTTTTEDKSGEGDKDDGSDNLQDVDDVVEESQNATTEGPEGDAMPKGNPKKIDDDHEMTMEDTTDGLLNMEEKERLQKDAGEFDKEAELVMSDERKQDESMELGEDVSQEVLIPTVDIAVQKQAEVVNGDPKDNITGERHGSVKSLQHIAVGKDVQISIAMNENKVEDKDVEKETSSEGKKVDGDEITDNMELGKDGSIFMDIDMLLQDGESTKNTEEEKIADVLSSMKEDHTARNGLGNQCKGVEDMEIERCKVDECDKTADLHIASEEQNIADEGNMNSDVFSTPLRNPINILAPLLASPLSGCKNNRLTDSVHCGDASLVDSNLAEDFMSELFVNPVYDTEIKHQLHLSESDELLPIYDTTSKLVEKIISATTIQVPSINMIYSGHEEQFNRVNEVEWMASAEGDCLSTEKINMPYVGEKELCELFARRKANDLENVSTGETSYLMGQVDEKEFELWMQTMVEFPKKKHETRWGYVFDNNFLLDLCKARERVTHKHIEVLVSLISWRLSKSSFSKGLTFVPPWFPNALMEKYKTFSTARNKKNVRWSKEIKNLVTSQEAYWFSGVDTIYMPMIWDDVHWVGIVIHLGNWCLEILDPNTYLYSDSMVAEFMAPVVEMVPYIIKRFCKPRASQSNDLTPLVWQRVNGIYNNARHGDSGPVTMKFLEMHCQEGSAVDLARITDSDVDTIRKRYALDIYKDMVVPLYTST